MWVYYCGVSRHLAETMDLSRCIFVGYSAGIIAPQHLSQNVVCDEEMFRRFYIDNYNTELKQCVTKVVWNGVPVAQQSMIRGYNDYNDNVAPVDWKRLFGATYSGVAEIVPSTTIPYGFALRARYLSGAVDLETHCRAYVAPFTIPGFTKFGLYTEIDGRMYVDHGFISKRGSCVAVNRATNKPLEKINIWPTKWRKHPLRDYWLTTDEVRLLRLYRMGYEDARANM